MEMMIESSFGLQMLNMLLLSVLLFIYMRNYMRMKSSFTLGLIIFAVFLLVQNVMGIYFGFEAMDVMNPPFENYAFFINFMETIAILSLFYVTWK
jgi:uncharacterized membrane protein